MIETKLFEVRDRATFIPVVAISCARGQPLNDEEDFLLGRSGYGRGVDCILLTRLSGGGANYDPYQWGNTPLQTAHSYIEANWKELISGEVIDCEVIRGESTVKKLSERVEQVIEATER